MVEEFFPHEHQEPICLLPQNSFSSLQGQRCTVKVYGVDIQNEMFGELSSIRAELSALLAEIDENGNYIVELRCNLAPKYPRQNVWFRFQFEDQVRKVQLLPLPLMTTCQFDPQFESTNSTVQTLGALLVVLSKIGGLSVHSIVLSRTSDDEPFRIAEFKKVSRGIIEDTFDFLEVSLFVDTMPQDVQGRPEEALGSVLYAGILPKSLSTRSQRLDVLACPLVRHKSPLFRFTTPGPTRAFKRTVVLTGTFDCSKSYLEPLSLPKGFVSPSSMRLLVACGTTKGISVSARRIGNLSYCTVATLSNSELKVIRLPALDRWSTEALKSEDILVVPLNESSLGDPSHVFHLRGGLETSQRISYLVVCQDRGADEGTQVAEVADTSILASMTFDPSPVAEFLEKDPTLPDWTATETRISVLPAHRQVLTDIAETLHDQGALTRKTSLSDSQECCDMLSLHPRSIHNEDIGKNLESPETAILGPCTLRTGISDSISTPLAGLNFSGDGDVTPAPPKSINEECENPTHLHACQQPSSNSLVPRSAKLVLVSVPAKEEMSSTGPVQTDIFPISDHFPSSFDALRVHEMENGIVLAAVATGSSKASILTVPFHRGSFHPSASMFNEMPPTQVDLPDLVYVKALDFESNRAGSLVLRATIAKAKNIFQGQKGLPSILLREQIVTFKTFRVPLTKRNGDDLNTTRPPKKRKSTTDSSKISTKLDMILKALQKFETNVNEKLSVLEKREIDNAERLSKLEMSFNFRYTRAEI